MLRYALLGILNYSQMNGYELKQFMDSSTTHFWHATQSQIYMTLKTLEQEGHLISEIHAEQDRLDRRVYTITETGRKELRQWLSQPLTEIEQSKDTLLLKLFFSAQLDKETILNHLRLQRALYQRLGETYQKDTALRIQRTAAEHPQLQKDTLLWDSTRRLGEMAAELYVRWLDETIELVQNEF